MQDLNGVRYSVQVSRGNRIFDNSQINQTDEDLDAVDINKIQTEKSNPPLNLNCPIETDFDANDEDEVPDEGMHISNINNQYSTKPMQNNS